MAAEHLILLRESSDRAALEHAEGVRVTQWISPRVALILAPSARVLRELRNTPGVVAVSEENLPEDLLSQLDSTESLFARAWLSRMVAEPKARKGDGLDWDAPTS